MSSDDHQPRARLLTYLDLFVAGEMNATTFAGNFEQVYNLELENAELAQPEAAAFADLFEKVAWFSPFEEERRRIPHYVGPEELLAAAQRAHCAIDRTRPRSASHSSDT